MIKNNKASLDKIKYENQIRKQIKELIEKRESRKYLFAQPNKSKYLKNLFNKRINAYISLQKSKLDYYLDKVKNQKYEFHRDYNILCGFQNNSLIQKNSKITNFNKNTRYSCYDKSFPKINKLSKNISLPNIHLCMNFTGYNKTNNPKFYNELLNYSTRDSKRSKGVQTKINGINNWKSSSITSKTKYSDNSKKDILLRYKLMYEDLEMNKIRKLVNYNDNKNLLSRNNSDKFKKISETNFRELVNNNYKNSSDFSGE